MSPTIDCSWVGAGPKIHDYSFATVPDLRIFVLVRSVVSMFCEGGVGGGVCSLHCTLSRKNKFPTKKKGLLEGCHIYLIYLIRFLQGLCQVFERVVLGALSNFQRFVPKVFIHGTKSKTPACKRSLRSRTQGP